MRAVAVYNQLSVTGIGIESELDFQAPCRLPSRDQRQMVPSLLVSHNSLISCRDTGTNRSRPGLDQALAAVRRGDTLVVPKLDRLARSVPDARYIADALVERGVALALGHTRYHPTDPMGKMFFNILATFAEFEADLIRLCTREGMAIARAKGKLRGKQAEAVG